MASKRIPQLYRKFYVSREFERRHLFQLLIEHYGIQRALYPGSFIHVTPSFVIPTVVYVDADKQARKFFGDPRTSEFIAQRKIYAQAAQVVFHAQDYRRAIPEPTASFDLMISQYAGFVSRDCRPYLKIGGLLVANDSHGDASLAAIDDAYELTAVMTHRGEKYRLTHDSLAAYFVPKSDLEITNELILNRQRGIGYKQTASVYIFRRVKRGTF